jgi:hypothetical protein
MSSPPWSPPGAFNDHELDLALQQPQNRAARSDEHENLIQKRVSSVSSIPFASSTIPEQSIPPLGRPTTKNRLPVIDLMAVSLSFLCLAAAITTVANENLSWRLGVGSNQLIVLGFLLSIMNLCFGSVTPTLFLHLEARFGSSKLQNYDGILRNRIFSSRLSFAWRLVLGLMLSLPLGLSAAYKNFLGGKSVKLVIATEYTRNSSYYGMFAPPGVQILGGRTGISLFSNATLPFTIASSSSNSTEPPTPKKNQAYGFNHILLDSKSSAMLDIPQPDYVTTVQQLLAPGESWNLTASVIGTVATFNSTITSDPDGYKSDLMSLCELSETSTGAYTAQYFFENYNVVLLDHPSPGDQSFQYIAIVPGGGLPTCTEFSNYGQRYDINRQPCQGTWSITRGGIQLIDGSCNATILPPAKQLIITNNDLFLAYFYMPTLVEFLAEFATSPRNTSIWKNLSMQTSVAAMLWSRITALNGAANNYAAVWNASLSYRDIGMIYPVNDETAYYIRPTLRKSGWLYLVLAIQPVLTLVALLLTTMLFSTPLDKGFGLISILSGIDRGSLDSLAGAGLSGELAESVRLTIRPSHEKQKGRIEYRVVTTPATAHRNGSLDEKIVYH